MRSLSFLALIATNLIPLIGVLFFAWNEVLVLALFWIENLIIGIFNVLKILILAIRNRRIKDFFIAGFFAFHYGLFWSVHGSFLWGLLDLPKLNIGDYFEHPPQGILELFTEGASILLAFLAMFGTIISVSILALVLSHGVSFIENFILGGGIFKQKVMTLMSKPYSQVLIMHAGLIIGAMAIDEFGATIWLLIIMIVFKLSVDVWQYQRRRQHEGKTTEADTHHA